MKKNTLLITGGTGFLGHHLIHSARNWNTHATYFQTPPTPDSPATFHHCDLQDEIRVRQLLTAIVPDIIIHTACSNRTPQEIEAIVPAARHVTQFAKESSGRFIHLSTDLVFDGEEAPYHEASVPNPISSYGRAKAHAEQIIAKLYPQAAIIRASLMYGIDPVDHQTRWLLNGIEKNETVRLFTDESRSPIWVYTLAASLLELADSDFSGVLHIAGPESFSRWDFGMKILDILHRVPTDNIIPATRAESGLNRPRDLTLDIRKAKSLLKTSLLSISEVRQQIHSADS